MIDFLLSFIFDGSFLFRDLLELIGYLFFIGVVIALIGTIIYDFVKKWYDRYTRWILTKLRPER